jgi:hypothetical protein
LLANLVPFVPSTRIYKSVGTLLQKHQPRRRPPRIFRPTRAGSTGRASSFRGDEGDGNEMAGECCASAPPPSPPLQLLAVSELHLRRRSPAPTSPAPQVSPRCNSYRLRSVPILCGCFFSAASMRCCSWFSRWLSLPPVRIYLLLQ